MNTLIHIICIRILRSIVVQLKKKTSKQKTFRVIMLNKSEKH